MLCIATLFAKRAGGAGDGNRTRTVSLGSNLIRRIHRVKAERSWDARTPCEAVTSREFPRVRARGGHGSGTGATSWTRTERSSVRFRKTAPEHQCGSRGPILDRLLSGRRKCLSQVEVKCGQRVFVKGSGRLAKELGGTFGPQQRNPADPRRAEYWKHRVDKAHDRDHGYVRSSHTRMVEGTQGRADGCRLACDGI